MTRLSSLVTALVVVAIVFWVARSNRFRPASFELDCTGPPRPPEAVEAIVDITGVMIRWQLDPDPQISTSYIVQAGTAAGASDRLLLPVPRGVHRVSYPLNRGTAFIRVLARNYCGTSRPSREVQVVVP